MIFSTRSVLNTLHYQFEKGRDNVTYKYGRTSRIISHYLLHGNWYTRMISWKKNQIALSEILVPLKEYKENMTYILIFY